MRLLEYHFNLSENIINDVAVLYRLFSGFLNFPRSYSSKY
jgi:hypothetical protein